MQTIKQTFEKLQNPADYQFEYVSCYQCGSEDSTPFIVGEEDLTGKEGQFQYVKCDDCEFVYQNPRIAPSQIKQFYDSEYIAHRKKTDWGMLTPLYERAMNKHDRDKEAIVTKYIKVDKNSKILDVGCAVGTYLLHMKDQHKCKISGVDFKEDLTYPRFSEIDFHCGLFYEQKIPENSYDVVTMWHFLEHCYSPKESLSMAHKVIKDTGRVVIEVPRLDSVSFKIFGNKWPGIQAPQHTTMFYKKSLFKMCEESGFEVVEYLPYGAFPPYFYLFAGAYFKMFGKGLNLNKIIAPYFTGQLLLTPVLMMQKKLNLSMQTIILKKKVLQ